MKRFASITAVLILSSSPVHAQLQQETATKEIAVDVAQLAQSYGFIRGVCMLTEAAKLPPHYAAVGISTELESFADKQGNEEALELAQLVFKNMTGCRKYLDPAWLQK